MKTPHSKSKIVATRSVHVALLRGINVGGKNKLPMKDLADIFVDTGCANVATYIQSGNVIFEGSAALAKKVAAGVRAEIKRRFSLTIPVVLRSGEELREVVSSNPFLSAGADPEHLHVAFLSDEPSADRVAAIDADRSPGDAFRVHSRDVFLHLPNGVAKTKLTNAFFDSKLATTSTVRNWRTILKLVELTRR